MVRRNLAGLSIAVVLMLTCNSCLCWLTGNCIEGLTTPSDPSPADGSINQQPAVILAWQNGDTDNGKRVTYDVYFGLSNPPPRRYVGQSSKSLELDSLSLARTYYWKVVVHEEGGRSLSSPVWNFTTVFPPEFLGVTYPNWAVNWSRGELRNITWHSAYAGPQVRIELWKSGLNLCTIVEATPNDGSFDWFLTECADVTDPDYRIKVTSLSNEILYDFSDFFTVSIPCPIEVLSPQARDPWVAFESRLIQWRPLGFGNSVKVSLLLYKGSQFLYVIAGITSDDGHYEWIVSDFNAGTGQDYRIRIQDLGDFDCSRFSEFFSIQSCPVTVRSPTNHELWPLSTQQIISWDPAELPETVALELYHDGEFVCVLENSVLNTGSFPWTVTRCTSPYGENFQIKVSGGSDGPCGFSGRYRLH